MSEEEKKAIDYLQLCYDLSTIDNESLPRLAIVLNLIERQNKSIEILVAQKEQFKKDSDKWFETTVRQAEKFIKINDKKDKTIDKLIECLAEERGTDEDEIREVFGCE